MSTTKVNLDKIKSAVLTVYQSHFLNLIEMKIDKEEVLMLKILDYLQSLLNNQHPPEVTYQKMAEYRFQLNKIVRERWIRPERVAFKDNFPELIDKVNEVISSVGASITKEQRRERFHALPGDRFYIKVIKSLKRASFAVSKTPRYAINLLRKKKKGIPYWSHTIPIHNLLRKHYLAKTIDEFRLVQDQVYPDLCGLFIELKSWEEKALSDGVKLTSDEVSRQKSNVQAEVKRLKAETREAFTSALDRNADLIAEELEKVGTLEYPAQLITEERVNKQVAAAEENWANNALNWQNTLFVLFDDWRSDLDIFILRFKVLAEFEKFQSLKFSKVREVIDPDIAKFSEFVFEAQKQLEKPDDSLPKVLKKIHYEASRKLDKEIVPRLVENFSNQPINNLINKLEIFIKQNTEALSENRVIIKSNEYDKPTKTEEFSTISLHELIVFETLDKFQAEANLVKKEFLKVFENATINSKDLDHIIIFSFSSAISAIETGKEGLDPGEIAREGLQRALNRVGEIKQNLYQSLEKYGKVLEEAVLNFCNGIEELTVNENVRELRIRITKAKAAKEAKQTITKIREQAQHYTVVTRRMLGTGMVTLQGYASRVGDRFFLTSNRPVLTKQVSDFLLEAQQSMNNLPVIYKRLYQIEPLEDMELFEGREKEYEQVTAAFNNWQTGRYASTVFIGEKWGGLTTFVNYTIAKSNFPFPVKRFSPNKNFYRENKFLDMLNSIFPEQNFKDIDEIVEFLNSGTKQVIIIEDLQNLYLRKVNGFITLKLLCQLITRTYTNVFWIATTTIYTWSYLSKTMGISEFFSYHITLGELSNEQVINLIWKRNRISGYNIIFEADEARLSDKKFQAMEKDMQQEVLMKEFFNSLNNFAKSNISLALLFWLLSTKEIDDESITVTSFKNPDLNFLSILSSDKSHLLHTLILHDGLTENQIYEVLVSNKTNIKLTLFELLQDGIVLESDDIYFVNPLIYRTLITQLKSKNLIH